MKTAPVLASTLGDNVRPVDKAKLAVELRDRLTVLGELAATLPDRDRQDCIDAFLRAVGAW